MGLRRYAKLALLMAFFAVGNVQATDCSKTNNKTDRVVCSDSYLRELDHLLNSMNNEDVRWDLARYIASDPKFDGDAGISAEDLADAQLKQWYRKRNSCKTRSCLVREYKKHITDLSCLNEGAGIGASQCSSTKLKFAEKDLTTAEERRISLWSKSSDNPEYIEELMRDEASTWRKYRSAVCALQGALPGADSAWINAMAVACNLNETEKRIAEVKKAEPLNMPDGTFGTPDY